MKKAIAIAVFMIIFVGSSFAVAAEMQTIRGKVICVRCYVHHGGGRLEACRQCVVECLKLGNPAGILEEGTGKIYLVVGDEHKPYPGKPYPRVELMRHFTKIVEAKGDVSERNGVSTISLKEIKEIRVFSADKGKEKR